MKSKSTKKPKKKLSKLRKPICGTIFFLSLLAAGAFADTAVFKRVPFDLFVIQSAICLAVMFASFAIGRLYEDVEEVRQETTAENELEDVG